MNETTVISSINTRGVARVILATAPHLGVALGLVAVAALVGTRTWRRSPGRIPGEGGLFWQIKTHPQMALGCLRGGTTDCLDCLDFCLA